MSYIFSGNASEIIQNWPLLSLLASIFYTFAHILPANLIRCYIFRHYLRYPFKKVFLGLLILISLEAAIQLEYAQIFSPRIGFVFHLVYFFYLSIVIKVPWAKQFCLIAPLGMVWFCLTSIAYALEYNFPLFPVPFFQTGLILLLETLLCLYFFWLYSEHFAAPLLANNSIPKLWSPLAGLTFVTLALSILASPFNEDRSFTAFCVRLIASCGGLIGTIIALYAAREAIRQRQLNSILAVTQEMHLAEQEHYQNLTEIEKNTQLFQNKLQVFVDNINNFLAQNNYLAINNYARGFLDQSNLSLGIPLCGNDLVNALINYWQGVLQNLAVETTWEINLGKQNPIDPLDMTAILGNLLRNATEALTKVTPPEKRYLKLVLLKLGDNLVITLDNSFDGQSQQDNEQNYLSSKLDFKSRGIGLDSIRSSVEKYDGTFNMEIQAKNFASSIVLPLPSKKIRANP